MSHSVQHEMVPDFTWQLSKVVVTQNVVWLITVGGHDGNSLRDDGQHLVHELCECKHDGQARVQIIERRALKLHC